MEGWMVGTNFSYIRLVFYQRRIDNKKAVYPTEHTALIANTTTLNKFRIGYVSGMKNEE